MKCRYYKVNWSRKYLRSWAALSQTPRLFLCLGLFLPLGLSPSYKVCMARQYFLLFSIFKSLPFLLAHRPFIFQMQEALAHPHVCSSQALIPCVSCRLYALIQCPSNRHLTHSVPINMHDQLYSSTLNSASRLTHLFSSGKSPGCFSFLIHLLFLLCVCTHLSRFLHLSHILPSSSFSSAPLSQYWCMMQWNITWQSTFPLFSISLRPFSPLPHFLSFIFTFSFWLPPLLHLLSLLSVPPPPSFPFSPHLSSSSCLSSCSSLPSLESSSFRLFH